MQQPIWETPNRKPRTGVRMACIVCFLTGTYISLFGGHFLAPIAGLLGLAGFVLIWFI